MGIPGDSVTYGNAVGRGFLFDPRYPTRPIAVVQNNGNWFISNFFVRPSWCPGHRKQIADLLVCFIFGRFVDFAAMLPIPQTLPVVRFVMVMVSWLPGLVKQTRIFDVIHDSSPLVMLGICDVLVESSAFRFPAAHYCGFHLGTANVWSEPAQRH